MNAYVNLPDERMDLNRIMYLSLGSLYMLISYLYISIFLM